MIWVVVHDVFLGAVVSKLQSVADVPPEQGPCPLRIAVPSTWDRTWPQEVLYKM